jgi:hypothetical protein
MSVLINFFSSLNINIKWRYAIAKCHANINLIITKLKIVKICKQTQVVAFKLPNQIYFYGNGESVKKKVSYLSSNQNYF